MGKAVSKTVTKEPKVMKHDFLDGLLFYADFDSAANSINTIKEATELQYLAQNYNWDNGFAIPTAIANNPYCDLGTALTLFYLADGYSFLEEETSDQSSDPKWEAFIGSLYADINGGRYTSKDIYFSPPISRVQIYNLKKSNPNISEVFFLEQGSVKVQV